MADILGEMEKCNLFRPSVFSNNREMFTSLTGFIKNVVKVKIESIFAIAAALLVLFTAMMDPYISAGIAGTLLVTIGIYKFVKRQKQERGYLNG